MNQLGIYGVCQHCRTYAYLPDDRCLNCGNAAVRLFRLPRPAPPWVPGKPLPVVAKYAFLTTTSAMFALGAALAPLMTRIVVGTATSTAVVLSPLLLLPAFTFVQRLVQLRAGNLVAATSRVKAASVLSFVFAVMMLIVRFLLTPFNIDCFGPGCAMTAQTQASLDAFQWATVLFVLAGLFGLFARASEL